MAETSKPPHVPARWERPALEPRLVEGVLHVWRADLAAAGDDLAALLSPEERTRAERLLSERARRRWVRSRGVLRVLLGRYLKAEAHDLEIRTGASGKPTLGGVGLCERPTAAHGSPEEAQVAFNLSHSGDLALYAFAPDGLVGVDVEVARRPIRELAIAARAFGPATAERLRSLDPASRRGEFLRLWVRHEAKLKCLGTGIGAGAAHRCSKEPWVADLHVGRDAAGAVAATRVPRRIYCFQWQS